MSLPDSGPLDSQSITELRGLVGVLIAEVQQLQSDSAILQDQVEAQQATITSLQTEIYAAANTAQRPATAAAHPTVRHGEGD
jgi:hypothetical protein